LKRATEKGLVGPETIRYANEFLYNKSNLSVFFLALLARLIDLSLYINLLLKNINIY